MKKIIYALCLTTLIASCQSAPEGETASTTEKQEAAVSTGINYKMDLTTSKVTFLGSKPVGTHQGNFKLTEGSIAVDNGNITGGNFMIDINSMSISDPDTNGAYKLIGHLLSPDFFDAAKFATAKFEITSCTPLTNDSNGTHSINGNLTLKDSTKNVNFPAKIIITETGLTATANFNIDRTQWGLFYGNDKSLGDKFIYPEVKIGLEISANK